MKTTELLRDNLRRTCTRPVLVSEDVVKVIKGEIAAEHLLAMLDDLDEQQQRIGDLEADNVCLLRQRNDEVARLDALQARPPMMVWIGNAEGSTRRMWTTAGVGEFETLRELADAVIAHEATKTGGE